jgi:DNA polymerase-3 subunit alpha
MATDQQFVHLRIHSEYSMVDGMVRINQLVSAAASKGMSAIAISDQSNLFGLVKFYSAAIKAGVKPIVACDFWVAPESTEDDPSLIVLIAQNDIGYRHMSELLSRGYLEGQRLGRAVVEHEWIREKSEGLIALSAARAGDIGRALISGRRDVAEDRLNRWMKTFPDRFYLELHRTHRDDEDKHTHLAVALAQRHSCPVVATNDVRFLSQDEYEAHEVRVCIHDGRTLDDPRRERRYSDQQYLKSSEEMCELFSDIPEAIENSLEIARRCSVTIDLGHNYLPEYPIPEGMTTEEFFEKESREGLEKRLTQLLDRDAEDFQEKRKPYDERLGFELGVINQMGFPGYFLIVMEFIQWAKQNNIPVGPGRGSGSGSLVAYALQITDLDPLKYDLLFERFLNPERVSMPDFDVDFCMEGRDRVIQHVSERYGRQAVSQIITFGTMAAKAVVRDVARVQGKPYGLADKLSKLIPFDPGMTLTKALVEEPLLKEFVDRNEEVQEIMEMAFKLEGLARNVGKHAGGVVIAPTRLTDFSPIYCDEDGTGLMTQFDKYDVEMAGLVKFDFLGLRTLTVIDWALNSINRRVEQEGGERVDIDLIPLDDPAVFRMLRQAKTTAVFQLESRGMKDLIKKLLPDTFEDIVALVALFRPGPMLMADDFINRKHGRDEVDYLHPDLEPVLRNTYGVMLYQEQVMQIAQVLADYSIAQADILRRAMGKKDAGEMAKQRETFLRGTTAKAIPQQQASYIFDLMEKFAGYGFNKSHSVAYALVAYQTAWLKVHYPDDFMAAVLSADMQATEKVVTNIEECREMGLVIVPPDINRGQFRFVADGKGKIIYGLGAIKGLGEGPIESIVHARSTEGQFKNLFDLCERVESRKLNKRVLEAMVGSGALDHLVPDSVLDTAVEKEITKEPIPDASSASPGDRAYKEALNWKRALLALNQEDATKMAEQKARDQSSGHVDLFGEGSFANDHGNYNHSDLLRSWSHKDRLHKENETLGLYLTGHPIEVYDQELKHLTRYKIKDLRPSRDPVTIAGWVISLRSIKLKRGGTRALVMLDDQSGRIELSVMGSVLEECREKLQKNTVLVVKGSVSDDDFSGGLSMRATDVWNLVQAREKSIKQLRVVLDSGKLEADFSARLARLLEPYKGTQGCRVSIDYSCVDASARLILGDAWRVRPHDDLIEKLQDHYGTEHVVLDY